MDRRQFSFRLAQSLGFVAASFCCTHAAQAQRTRRVTPSSPVASDDSDWTLYTHHSFGVAMRFPAEPQMDTQAAAPLYFASIQQHTLSLSIGDNPDGLTRWTTQRTNEMVADSLKNGLRVETTNIIAPTILEYQGALPKAGQRIQLIGRYHLTHELEYIAVARTHPGIALDPTLAQKFFRSIRFLPRTVAQATPAQPDYPNTHYAVCRSCNGRGRTRTSCYRCAGTGQNSPAFWNTEGRTCRMCYGRGYSSEYSCSTCNGQGRILVRR